MKGKLQEIWYNISYYIREYRSLILKSSAVLCIISLIFGVSILFNVSRDISAYNNTFMKLEKDLRILSESYRNMILRDSVTVAEIHSRALRDIISEKIKFNYQGSKHKFKQDLDDYLATNNIENTLYLTFTEESYNYLNRWFPNRKDVRIIITDRSHILFTSEFHDPIRKNRVFPMTIFDKTDDNILTIDDTSGVISEQIFDLFAQKTTDLKKITLLSPSYIYDHEDILGVKDAYPDGTSTDNSKLAIIVAYKPLNQTSVLVFKSMDEELQKNMEYQYAEVISDGVVHFAIAMLSVLFFGSVWYLGSKLPR